MNGNAKLLVAEDAIRALRELGFVDVEDVVMAAVVDGCRALGFATNRSDLTIAVLEEGEEPRTVYFRPEDVKLLRAALGLLS